MIAAQQSGRSLASELETRLEATFTVAQISEPTKALLQRIAKDIAEYEATQGPWHNTIKGWAVVRELLANGPILEVIPHPDAIKAKKIEDRRSKLVDLRARRDEVVNKLAAKGVFYSGSGGLGHMLMAAVGILPKDPHAVIDAHPQHSDDLKASLHEEVDRLDELDAEINGVLEQLSDALLPYYEAREAAREYIYGVNGTPDLPDWATAPLGMDEDGRRKKPNR
jgi:hypothetical protein